MNTEVSEQTQSNKALDEVLDWIESLFFSIFVVLFIFSFVFRQVSVVGPSMNPTLTGSISEKSGGGDRMLISHLVYESK